MAPEYTHPAAIRQQSVEVQVVLEGNIFQVGLGVQRLPGLDSIEGEHVCVRIFVGVSNSS